MFVSVRGGRGGGRSPLASVMTTSRRRGGGAECFGICHDHIKADRGAGAGGGLQVC
jgi:hypothetical protein